MSESKVTPDAKSDPVARPVALRGLKGRLINSSIDAYVLSLETINRLSVRYRLEAFNYLIINAWELLLKAKLIHENGNKKAIMYDTKPGEPERSLSIGDCLRKVYNEKSNVRKNIEWVEKQRHKSTHLVTDVLPPDILSIYQACVVNYHRALTDWFGLSLKDRVPVGMMTIVYDIDALKIDLTNNALVKRLGKDTVKHLMASQRDIAKKLDGMENSVEFSAQVGFSVSVLNNSRDRGDIRLVGGKSDEVAMVIHKPRDPSLTHPYYARDAAKEVSSRLPEGISIKPYDVRCAVAVGGLDKGINDYHYRGGMSGDRAQYSPALVDLLVDQYSKNDYYFTECRGAKRLMDLESKKSAKS